LKEEITNGSWFVSTKQGKVTTFIGGKKGKRNTSSSSRNDEKLST
jgi:hypothetical protein